MLSKKQVELGLVFLNEQKRQGGKVLTWNYEIKKQSARRYAFDLKRLCKEREIDISQYIAKLEQEPLEKVSEELHNELINKPVKEVKEVKSVEEKDVVEKKDVEEKGVLEKKEETSKVEEKKEEKKAEEAIEKTAVRKMDGRDIIKRNVMRSREQAKMFVKEQANKQVPSPQQPQPSQQPVEKEKGGFWSFFKSNPLILVLLGLVVGTLVIMFFMRRKEPEPKPVVTKQSSEKQLATVATSLEDTIYSDLMRYKTWLPEGK